MTKLIARTAILVCVLLPLAACGGESQAGPSETVKAADKPEQRKPAPKFKLKDAEGREVSLSDFKGKVVLLNFWATWCGPCKIEMPWFVDFQRKYKDKGFTVLAVSLDEEGWDVIKPFAEELKLNFPIVLGSDEVADQFGGIAALPTTFIIDKEGRIFNSHMGLVSMSDYEDEIKQLL